jgi:DNA polymerase III subunit epsilon
MRFFLRSPPWDSVTYWSIDLETGGFDARQDAILAVGMVPMRGGIIRMREAYRTLVRPEDGRSIDPGSVHAHQLVWGEVRDAPPLSEVLREIDVRLREGVMLVHFRSIEIGFLKRACKRHGLRWAAPRVVDTADLLRRRASMQNPESSQENLNLNLSEARREFGLPAYQAHDALTDAVATAELFLTLRRVLGAQTVRDVLS